MCTNSSVELISNSGIPLNTDFRQKYIRTYRNNLSIYRMDKPLVECTDPKPPDSSDCGSAVSTTS